MKVILRTFDLQLKHTFTISRESYDVQPTLIVELQSDGYSGFGEATSNPYYKITVDSMRSNLERIIPIIESITNETPEEFWNIADKLLENDRFALCALDIAYNDLYAQKKDKKLYELWGYSIDNNPKPIIPLALTASKKWCRK